MTRTAKAFHTDLAPARARILAHLGTPSPFVAAFIAEAFRDTDPHPSARALAFALGDTPSGLVSRCWRMGLPSPKRVLWQAQLIRAGILRGRGLSHPQIAFALGYSSPNAWRRAVLSATGESPVHYFAGVGILQEREIARCVASPFGPTTSWGMLPPPRAWRVAA